MTWRAYQVVLRLRSPMHIGCGEVGNLLRTRFYVTGRSLWGALTMRLTRDAAQGRGPATDSREYRRVGEQVHRSLAFTYFYPALKRRDDYRVVWPWENESAFRSRFLSSYQSTALSYPHQSAATGMLHEVEFISPHTLDSGEEVFLQGYVFEREGCTLDWLSSLERLQLGGERGYGWGDVELVSSSESADERLFGGPWAFEGGDDKPIVRVPTGERLLAHSPAEDTMVAEWAAGHVEPLVGREWRSDNLRRRHAGQHVEFAGICLTPGNVVREALEFAVGEFGMWQRLNNRA